MADYGLDVLNITMHTEVVIHLMNAYVWFWSKLCGSLDEILSLTMGSYESKILNKFFFFFIFLFLFDLYNLIVFLQEVHIYND